MIFVVVNKLTGAEVTRYAASAPVDTEFSFSEFSHIEFPDNAPVSYQVLGKISKLEYMDRFSDTELAAIYGAAKIAPTVEIWLEKFKLAEFIDLSDPRTLAGLQALEANGLIGTGRSLEILHGQ